MLDALEYAKSNWESPINFSIIPWIRENCCELNTNRYGRIGYRPLMIIEGNDKNKYLSQRIPAGCLSKPCIIKKVNSSEDLIKLSFKPNRNFDHEQLNDLVRLFMLHLALKEQRNVSNHASSSNRATVDEVKTAIYTYIDLTEKIFDVLHI